MIKVEQFMNIKELEREGRSIRAIVTPTGAFAVAAAVVVYRRLRRA